MPLVPSPQGNQDPSVPITGHNDTAAAALRVHTVSQGDGGIDRSSWGDRRGCSGGDGRRGAVPRGAAAAPTPPPRSLGHPLPRETVATSAATRRLRSAQPREAGPLLRAHPERVGASGVSGQRAGPGSSQVMLAAKGCEGPLGFSALSKPTGLFHPGRRGRRSFLLAKLLCLAWPGMARGKIWPGDSDSATFGARPCVLLARALGDL